MADPDEIEPPTEWKPAREISSWSFAIGLLALYAAFVWVKGTLVVFPRHAHLLLTDLAELLPAIIIGWAIVAIPEVIARRRGTARTAIRRNALIASWIFGGLLILGVTRSPSDTLPPRSAQAVPDTQDLPVRADTDASHLSDEDSRPSDPRSVVASPAPSSSPANDAERAKPTPWVEITRKPEYRDASTAEREAIRDVDWRFCIEELVAADQRTAGYEAFRRDWEIVETDVPAPPSRTMSVPEYLRQQREGARSPVSAKTMTQWCQPE
jgi:hypothetical protein